MARKYLFDMSAKKEDDEAKIQDDIIKMLRGKEWFARHITGNMYTNGFPDLYVAHKRYGARWIEVKRPIGYRFTPAQLEVFGMLAAAGVGVWILTAGTEAEYMKLFQPANYSWFLPLFRKQ